jgi:hypothetical protein
MVVTSDVAERGMFGMNLLNVLDVGLICVVV